MNQSGVTAYAGVNATTRALYSQLLAPQTRQLLAQARNLDALVTTLTTTAYAPYLSIDRQALTPRRVVYQLRWHLAQGYDKLIRMTPKPGRTLLIQLWRLYEVDNLKATLRGIATGASWNEVLHLLSPMARHITLTLNDMQRMLESATIARAINRIRHTPYYETLLHALERYEAEQNLFPLEVALDLDYRRAIWQAIHNLKGVDHEHALRLVGTFIDADNLLWAARYRVYHQLSTQEVINYTLPFGYQVRDEDIRAIATSDAGDSATIIEVIRRLYPDLEELDSVTPQRWLAALERALNRRIARLCHKAFRGDPFHIGVPVAYLILLEYELRDLTAIVEAIASGLPVETLVATIDL